MRLSSSIVKSLPESVVLPDYQREERGCGIVHFGLGAFTRAHQALYTDEAMAAGGGDWMIRGVSLRSRTVGLDLNPQDGLYLIESRSGKGASYRLGGAIRDVLYAPDEGSQIIEALSEPGVRIASFTVTEKGYCRAADGTLDLDRADAGSFYPLLASAFRARMAAGLSGLTLLSCDNLAANGEVLGGLLAQYLEARAKDVLRWYEEHCTTPCSMVDRIVPATTMADRERAEAKLGVDDAALVVTEDYRQWVIEDRFAAGRPQWEKVGAQLVGDVKPYEMAKLRMLNGAHSLLAYKGLEAGYDYIHEAVADPVLRDAALRLMVDEAAPTVPDTPGIDTAAYAKALLARFDNADMRHSLAQIAMDGSQKIAQRWLEPLAIRQARGASSPVLVDALGAWLRHVEKGAELVHDPLAEPIANMLRTQPPSAAIEGIFGAGGLVRSAMRLDEAMLAAIASAFGKER